MIKIVWIKMIIYDLIAFAFFIAGIFLIINGIVIGNPIPTTGFLILGALFTFIAASLSLIGENTYKEHNKKKNSVELRKDITKIEDHS